MSLVAWSVIERDAVLEGPHVVGVGQFYHEQLVVFLDVLRPAVRLTLRIDHQRPNTHSQPATK